VLVVTGAGVSAESNVPTFRGPGGYWRNMDPQRLATPEAFSNDPALVWAWYDERRDRIRAAHPNPAHRAIAALAGIARDFLLVTQNVNDLHERAGSSAPRRSSATSVDWLTRSSTLVEVNPEGTAISPYAAEVIRRARGRSASRADRPADHSSAADSGGARHRAPFTPGSDAEVSRPCIDIAIIYGHIRTL
jgi:hypothetical protein